MEKNKATIEKTITDNVYIKVDGVVIATVENIFGDYSARMRNAEKIVKLWNKSMPKPKKEKK